MTNWMTATGIALIAGGLATLICFRRVLWTGRGRRRLGTEPRVTRTRAIGARRPDPEPDRAVLPAQADAPEISGAHFMAETAADGADLVAPEEEPQPAPLVADVDRSDVDAEYLEALHPDVEADWRRDVESDRPTGDYWMPVPESAYADLDAVGHGWPVRSERDPDVESEPTAVVPTWPPASPFDQIELPRRRSEAPGRRTPARRWDEADRMEGHRRQFQVNDEVADRHWAEADPDGRDGWRRNFGPEDEHLTLRAAERRRRPRPRPNPTVYVSRHAAE